MKVLHVIPSLSPALGGPTVVALRLVSHLRACGVDAEIVTTNDNGGQVLDVPLGERILYQQVPVWFLPRFSLPMKEFLFSVALTRWLWQHAADYDLLDLHYLFSYAPTCAGMLARWQQIPYTVRTQGQLAPWALRQSQSKKQLYSWLIERRHLNRAAAVHCTASLEVEDVRRYGITAPTKVLPLGVRSLATNPNARGELRQRYRIPLNRPIILFLSRLHYVKQPDVLLRVIHQLTQRGCSAHLLMAGTGDAAYVHKLRGLIMALGLEDTVTLTGFVTGTDKQLLLQGADMFALPSQTENFSMAIAEAMAAGLPVVITPEVQIAPDILSAGAGVVAKGTCDDFTAAIAGLLADPDRRHQMGERGQHWAKQHYDWSVIAGQLTQVYSGILRQQSQETGMSAPVVVQ
ncbi:glycosyltransferase [Leptothoe sp. EHU-05/26/07-4]|uniref:Glycosyltransferase n=1 Tax=Adonisia turfae CCMR0081 TaxID=2292702 RepID=A0A6M0RXH3_9CYAN|nr:glycosyltransferase [Adonisia turfae]NEZ60856.1 glycosyltransferase [Adonisia turfae CCMR0081]